MTLTVEQTKQAWIFKAFDGDLLCSEMTAIPSGDSVVIHNAVHRFSRDNLRVYLAMWRDIRGYLREHGVRLVVPCSDRCDDKMRRYWRLMGFKCFGSIGAVEYAVMEA